jgi:anhydro-N-acetylmuramic acid kinase
MRVIGLMSGTSADGVDAALVEWPHGPEARPFTLLAFREEPMPAELQARIHRLAAGRVPGSSALRELATLDVEIGERFAAAAASVASSAGVPLSEVDAIASHGQTVAHHPEERATLQIGDPSVVAERTGCTTVADFRPRDVAAGGEGAPLAPFFHLAAFGDHAESRVALNLGGIANVTWLPAGGRPEAVIAFDVGPANALLDGVVQRVTGGAERFDQAGRRALRGRVDVELLERLLDDDFLRRPPPKSTGRERYGLAEAEALADDWERAQRDPDDLIATLAAFTSEAVARACRDFLADFSKLGRVLGRGRRASRRRRGHGLLADGAQRAPRHPQPPAALHRCLALDSPRRDRSRKQRVLAAGLVAGPDPGIARIHRSFARLRLAARAFGACLLVAVVGQAPRRLTQDSPVA